MTELRQSDNEKNCRSVMQQHWEEKEEDHAETDRVIFIDDEHNKLGSRKNAPDKNFPLKNAPQEIAPWVKSSRKIGPRKITPKNCSLHPP